MKETMKRIVTTLLVMALVAGLVQGSTVQAKTKTQFICVSKIKGNTIFYYSVEWNSKISGVRAYGKIKKMKIKSNAKFYYMKWDESYGRETAPIKVSRKKFIKRIKKAKKNNGKGFYVVPTKKKGKCIKLEEFYLD